MGKNRTSNEVIQDILKACPTHVNNLMLKANVSYRPIMKCVNSGLLSIHKESPKLYGMSRKKAVKIYRVTKKGIEFLHKERNIKDGN